MASNRLDKVLDFIDRYFYDIITGIIVVIVYVAVLYIMW